MGGALYYQMMTWRKAVLALIAAAIAPEEVDLLARSLRPEGRAEMEANAALLSALPVAEVQAELDPSRARVEGQLRLVVRNRESAPWYEVVLRAYPNAARGTWLRIDDVRVEGKRVAARSHGSVISVPLELSPGASAAISMSFHGQMRRLREGEGEELLSAVLPSNGGYGTFAAGPQGAALVDWYPQLAARAHGVWDREEPGPLGDASHADPANAVVALTVPHGWRVAAAGTALGQHPVTGGKETATFAAAGIRGSLGMAASPMYDEVTEQSSAIELRASSMHGEAGARALLSCARQALQSLQARFGPYPWTALAVAEVPLTGGAGGVELPGLALIAAALAGRALPAGLFEFTCYHEVAHQWWQGVVGSDPRRAPWVDEALAQYSAILVTEDVRGKEAADQALSTYVALNYHGMRLARVADGRVARAADDFRTPLAYAGLIYGKAPLFFDKARAVLGDAGFDAVSRAYRQAWAFREAGGDGWLQAARRVAPDRFSELSALQKRWWEEKHGDEDIAPPDGLALMEALGGTGGDNFAQLLRALQDNGAGDDAQVREALKQLQKLIPELSRMLQETQP
ncbi:MAG: hypothetical protein LC689_05340 [Myxococcales bacterium]|nr:hypothetical protein [Myxococcales bacterium]